MRLRWRREAETRAGGAWLEFRSASFYDDRLKEVPNRLLDRWATARRQSARSAGRPIDHAPRSACSLFSVSL